MNDSLINERSSCLKQLLHKYRERKILQKNSLFSFLLFKVFRIFLWIFINLFGHFKSSYHQK